MEIQGKVWGHNIPIFCKHSVEINRIFTKKGGFCSKHRHLHKYNMFFVECGKISIEVWKNDYGLVDKTIIKNLESCIVPPLEFHRFTALEDSVVYEIYWVQIDSKDIERESCGGKKEG